ncbi:hypothetical protein DFH06DRAFT_106134 [Mycena polygramma]|nr:hypothetical protein DFH06DRAFT_1251761 [Mycena polygramma]KAJ7616793.1 hypothetical protein DFH06DRAFT_106134 [Mycena polygramma]
MPTSATAAGSCSVTSGVTFVINAQGPGPLTFNIHLSGASSPETISVTVNTADGVTNAPPRSTSPVIRPAATRQAASTPARRPFLLPRSQLAGHQEVLATPQGNLAGLRSIKEQSPGSQNQLLTGSQEVPETPQGMLAELRPSNNPSPGSQSVQAAVSPQGSLADCSDTEDSDTYAFHDIERPALFSPRCQLVSPSRKRRLERMDDPNSPSPRTRKRKCDGLVTQSS